MKPLLLILLLGLSSCATVTLPKLEINKTLMNQYPTEQSTVDHLFNKAYYQELHMELQPALDVYIVLLKRDLPESDLFYLLYRITTVYYLMDIMTNLIYAVDTDNMDPEVFLESIANLSYAHLHGLLIDKEQFFKDPASLLRLRKELLYEFTEKLSPNN